MGIGKLVKKATKAVTKAVPVVANPIALTAATLKVVEKNDPTGISKMVDGVGSNLTGVNTNALAKGDLMETAKAAGIGAAYLASGGTAALLASSASRSLSSGDVVGGITQLIDAQGGGMNGLDGILGDLNSGFGQNGIAGFLGSTIASKINKPQTQAAEPQIIVAPAAVSQAEQPSSIKKYLMIGGAVLVVGLLGFVLFRKRR